MTKLFKFKSFLLICVFTLIVPFSVFADEIESVEPLGAGTWDQIYYSPMTVGTSVTRTSSFTSGGGDIRVCVENVDIGNKISFQFAKTSGSAVGPSYVYDNVKGSTISPYFCFPKLDVRPYVDSTGKVSLQLTANGIKSSDIVVVEVED